MAGHFSIKRATTKNQLDYLYGESAMTFEGLSESSLGDLYSWLVSEGAEPAEECIAFTISGAVMNELYELTGQNAYPDDLTIVSVPLSELAHAEKIFISMRQYGGRWFDDVVENNLRREREKDGE